VNEAGGAFVIIPGILTFPGTQRAMGRHGPHDVRRARSSWCIPTLERSRRS